MKKNGGQERDVRSIAYARLHRPPNTHTKGSKTKQDKQNRMCWGGKLLVIFRESGALGGRFRPKAKGNDAARETLPPDKQGIAALPRTRKTGQFRTARPPSRPGRTIQPTRPGNAKHAAGRCCVSFEFFMELVPDHRHRSTPDRAGSNSPIGSGGSITFGDGIVC